MSGSLSQALGLAEAMALHHTTPSFSLIYYGVIRISFANPQNTSHFTQNQRLMPPWPDYVIASAKRTVIPTIASKSKTLKHALSTYKTQGGTINILIIFYNQTNISKKRTSSRYQHFHQAIISRGIARWTPPSLTGTIPTSTKPRMLLKRFWLSNT